MMRAKLTETRAIVIGVFFQVTMMCVFLFSILRWGFEESSPLSLIFIPSHIGFVIFGWYLYVLYVQKKRETQLITTGLFKYTRHPMYTGLALMNLAHWLPYPPGEMLFYVVQIIFIFCLITAGWLQEKETIIRFGKDAEEYYKKTPRLFFCYPFCKYAK